MPDELFTTVMKKATRKAHAISDALVNAKLLFALNNDNIWAEGLLIFYEIFKFLENSVKERPNENIGKLYIEKMNRTLAFEEDLAFYLGTNWKKDYIIRESVKNYLSHLKKLLNSDSDLLMAYIYHLYMGLLSGGQILQKKRELQRKVMNCHEYEGFAVTQFKDVIISDLKAQLKNKMNSIAGTLDETKKALLIEESINVFKLNNSIIRTVKGAESIAFRNIVIVLSALVLALSLIYYIIINFVDL